MDSSWRGGDYRYTPITTCQKRIDLPLGIRVNLCTLHAPSQSGKKVCGMGRKNKHKKGPHEEGEKVIDGPKLNLERSKSPAIVPSSSSSWQRESPHDAARVAPQGLGKKKFLTPQDGKAYEELVRDHYQGFVHIPVGQIRPSNFHSMAKMAFERLRDSGYYQYDIVKAGGQHASRTFVKRTLVGEPGITYKYLGLRLFAHAWRGPGVSPVMKTIGDLNQHMIHMTKAQGKSNHGKCDYNLTLINFMEPSSHTKVGFKDEAFYGMGKVSVSWHADSSLEKNSSIGVYHCLPSQKSTKWDWRIGLRRIPKSTETANEVTPIVTSTKDGDIYFLLGTFNETHQHCVLSGSECNRISSTHRVAVTQEDTYEYIKHRAKGALKRFRLQLEGDDRSKMDPKVIVYCQRVLSEIEFEWIAQYWLQGAEHDKMHTWWQGPMRALEMIWLSLEELTFQLCQLCMTESESSLPRLVRKGLLAELQNRQQHRRQWEERRADKIYQRRIQAPYRPVNRPTFDEKTTTTTGQRLGKDLDPIIDALSKIRTNGRIVQEKDVKPKKPSSSSPARERPTVLENRKKRVPPGNQPNSVKRRKKHIP